jgi:hypothetical protein
MAQGKVQVLIIHADGSGHQSLIDPTLETLQTIVGGDIEIVTIGDCHLYCNEEGKLQGLPINIRATEFAWTLGWPQGDVLCGNVVFLGNGPDGLEGNVPQHVLDAWDRGPSLL